MVHASLYPTVADGLIRIIAVRACRPGEGSLASGRFEEEADLPFHNPPDVCSWVKSGGLYASAWSNQIVAKVPRGIAQRGHLFTAVSITTCRKIRK